MNPIAGRPRASSLRSGGSEETGAASAAAPSRPLTRLSLGVSGLLKHPTRPPLVDELDVRLARRTLLCPPLCVPEEVLLASTGAGRQILQPLGLEQREGLLVGRAIGDDTEELRLVL